MNRNLKNLLKRYIPISVLNKIQNLLYAIKRNKTKEMYLSSSLNPEWLSIDDLEQMQLNYESPPEYGYSVEIVEQRGEERASQLMRLIPNSTGNNFLELGCWDGMVSCSLKQKGKTTYAIDNRDEGFDVRATKEGVELEVMDASDLRFNDDFFDVVFSYDAFEHFSEPGKVFEEMYRVTKPGGYIFLEFGPLYMSPNGLHAYRQITVPYCQMLFEKSTLIRFLNEKKLGSLDFSHCNGWSLLKFRSLWGLYSAKLEKIMYEEIHDYHHLDLIREYPSCFKSKTNFFDDLTCSSISLLFRKL